MLKQLEKLLNFRKDKMNIKKNYKKDKINIDSIKFNQMYLELSKPFILPKNNIKIKKNEQILFAKAKMILKSCKNKIK